MPAHAVPVLQPRKGSGGLGARLAGARILVVDDDDDSRELTCALLEMAGATVLCVRSVAQAMSGVHAFDPDVVVTDFAMPGADGLDLIRGLRTGSSARIAAVPILVLSGYGEGLWRARALAAGAADVLTKPFPPVRLIARIAAAVAAPRSAS
jgi:CheY-like chemotaxis protein